VAIFFVGVAVLLWGVAKLKLAEVAKAEVELKERQYNYERTRGEKG
jgi:predicted small integral membrane protein